MTAALLDGNMNLLWSSLIVNELVKNGIDTFFISPGNRNVPLIAALAQHPGAVKRLSIDERASAFRALGHAKASGKAGVLVCTSGTALSNYFPAVIEACEDGLPLVVISADRPPEFVGSHANQSIEQTGIYGRFALEQLNLPCPDESYPLDALLSKIDYLLSIKNGPVHINCPFREPLLNRQEGPSPIPVAYLSDASEIFETPRPFTEYLPIEPTTGDLKAVEEAISGAKKGMIVIGRMAPAVQQDDLLQFISRLGWPVYCDIASGLKGSVEISLQIPVLDHPKALEIIKSYKPDVILQFGTGLVSKHYYQTILPELKANVILVTARSGVRDPAHRVTLKIPIRVDRFARACAIQPCSEETAQLRDKFLESIQAFYQRIEQRIPTDRLSIAQLSRLVINDIPEHETLFLGNSLAVRAFDGVQYPRQKTIEIITNRGGSGIEGNLATTIGYAESSQHRVTAMIGDVSLLHDLNSLLLMKESRAPVILIVPNNGGGKIFDRLPARDFPEVLTPYLTTPHSMDFKHIAAQFSLDYRCVATSADFTKAYRQVLREGGSLFLEVSIDPEQDLEIFGQMQQL